MGARRISHSVFEAKTDLTLRIKQFEKQAVYQFMYNNYYKENKEKKYKREKAILIVTTECITEIVYLKVYGNNKSEQSSEEKK